MPLRYIQPATQTAGNPPALHHPAQDLGVLPAVSGLLQQQALLLFQRRWRRRGLVKKGWPRSYHVHGERLGARVQSVDGAIFVAVAICEGVRTRRRGANKRVLT